MGDAQAAPAEKSPLATLLPSPSAERELAFLSKELKHYQEQARLLAKQLRDTTGRLHTLQSEHQFSTDADERLDALRRHFQERIRDMERRYAEKEARWKSTLQLLRSHLDVAPPVDVDAPAFVDGPEPADDTRG